MANQWTTIGCTVTIEQAAAIREAATSAGITPNALIFAYLHNATNNFQAVQIPERLPRKSRKSARNNASSQKEIA